MGLAAVSPSGGAVIPSGTVEVRQDFIVDQWWVYHRASPPSIWFSPARFTSWDLPVDILERSQYPLMYNSNTSLVPAAWTLVDVNFIYSITKPASGAASARYNLGVVLKGNGTDELYAIPLDKAIVVQDWDTTNPTPLSAAYSFPKPSYIPSGLGHSPLPPRKSLLRRLLGG